MSRSPVVALITYHSLIYTAGGGRGYLIGSIVVEHVSYYPLIYTAKRGGKGHLNSSIPFNSRTVPISGVRDEVRYRVLTITKELYGFNSLCMYLPKDCAGHKSEG